MPIMITIKNPEEKRVNLEHLQNISIEYYGEPQDIDDKELKIYFENAGYAKQYAKIIESYFL